MPGGEQEGVGRGGAERDGRREAGPRAELGQAERRRRRAERVVDRGVAAGRRRRGRRGKVETTRQRARAPTDAATLRHATSRTPQTRTHTHNTTHTRLTALLPGLPG